MRTVLVVDDEKEIRYIVQRFLTRSGFSVMTASCGKKAIEIIIAKTRIDIILLDLKMPRGDGFAVLREMRKLKCVIPVIIIGGSVGNEEDIRILEELGYPESEIIYKPANLMALLAQIKKKTSSERS